MLLAEISKSPISTLSQELAHHPAARQRITREMKVRDQSHRSEPKLALVQMSYQSLFHPVPAAEERRRRLIVPGTEGDIVLRGLSEIII
jgi:hypothetical protein